MYLCGSFKGLFCRKGKVDGTIMSVLKMIPAVTSFPLVSIQFLYFKGRNWNGILRVSYLSFPCVVSLYLYCALCDVLSLLCKKLAHCYIDTVSGLGHKFCRLSGSFLLVPCCINNAVAQVGAGWCFFHMYFRKERQLVLIHLEACFCRILLEYIFSAQTD